MKVFLAKIYKASALPLILTLVVPAILLVTPQRVEAAISAVTARGSSVQGTGNVSSITVTPTGTITVGKMAFLAVATDNSATVDGCGETSHSVEDTAGNTWTRILECTETDGAVDDGAKISLFATKVTTQLTTSNTVTVTFQSSRSDIIAMLFEATVTAGNTLEVAQTGTGQNSLTAAVSSLTSREYLFLYHAGAEGEDAAKSPTTNYTELFDIITTTSGALDVNIAAYVQTRIATLTSSSALPTAWTFTNAISSLTALFEEVIPTLSIAQPDGVSDTVTVGTAYNITYTSADSDDTVTTAFYYDTNTDMTGGVAITGACATAAEGTGATCSWDTTGVTPGSYYVYGVTSGSAGIGATAVSAVSSGQITIDSATVAPTVQTNTETNVGTQGGTMNGEITATGGADSTERGFAWGKSSDLTGTDTSTTTETGTFGISTHSQTLSGLLSNTTYYFRAYATNSAGTGFGGIDNFVTTSSQTPSRVFRLFEGFAFKLLQGKFIIHQR